SGAGSDASTGWAPDAATAASGTLRALRLLAARWTWPLDRRAEARRGTSETATALASAAAATASAAGVAGWAGARSGADATRDGPGSAPNGAGDAGPPAPVSWPAANGAGSAGVAGATSPGICRASRNATAATDAASAALPPQRNR